MADLLRLAAGLFQGQNPYFHSVWDCEDECVGFACIRFGDYADYICVRVFRICPGETGKRLEPF